MPNISITPLQLAYTGGEATFEPARATIAPLRLNYTGGATSFQIGGDTTLTALDLGQLARIRTMFPIVGGDGKATQQFQQHFQSALEAIEATINSIAKQVNDNTTLIARLQAAETLSRAANDNADATQSAIGIANSYTDPVAVLSAANDGTITISAHDRVYGDGTTVSVNSGSNTDCASGDNATVYYVDAAREGGAVTYQATKGAVSQTDDTHIVGQVLIPASGQPPASGSGPTAPGYTPPSGGSYDSDYIEP